MPSKALARAKRPLRSTPCVWVEVEGRPPLLYGGGWSGARGVDEGGGGVRLRLCRFPRKAVDGRAGDAVRIIMPVTHQPTVGLSRSLTPFKRSNLPKRFLNNGCEWKPNDSSWWCYGLFLRCYHNRREIDNTCKSDIAAIPVVIYIHKS